MFEFRGMFEGSTVFIVCSRGCRVELFSGSGLVSAFWFRFNC